MAATAPDWTAELVLLGLVVGYFVLVTLGIWLSQKYHRRQRLRQLERHLDRPSDSLRRRLQVWLTVTTRAGHYLDLLQGLLSAVSCGLYVWETYQSKEDLQHQGSLVNIIELVFSSLFLMDYWLRFFLAKARIRYVWSLMGIVDVITVLPVFVYIGVPRPSKMMSEAPMYFRLVRLIKFLRVLRSLRIVRATVGFGLRRRVFTLISSVVALIFVAAGGFHFIEERSSRGLEFHTALYYTTIETLGRPRIESVTDEGYLWLIALVALSVVLIPKQLAELFSVARAETVWQRKRLERHGVQHIVLTGHQDFGSLNIILYEFYHKDRGYHSSDVVLFFDEPPTREVEMLLEHPAYVSHVQYVQGSPLVEDDLQRVDISNACAVLVIANKNPHNVFWEDLSITSTILSCQATWRRRTNLEKDAQGTPQRRLRILAEVLKPETRHQLLRTPGWQHDDVVIVIEEFSSLMVGLNALHRGFTTLIFNLFSHVEEQPSAPAWYREYEQGACQEIYRVRVSDSLAGASMEDAAAYLLREKRILLLAMEISCAQSGAAGVELVLYPGQRNVTLSRGDVIYCIAYNVFLVNHTDGSARATSVMGESSLLEAADVHLQGECEKRATWMSSLRSRSSATRGPTARDWAKRMREEDFVDPAQSIDTDPPHLEPGAVSEQAARATASRAPHVSFELDNEGVVPEGQQEEARDTPQSTTSSTSLMFEAEPSPSQVHATKRKPGTTAPHADLGSQSDRTRVLDWMLTEGFGGDRHTMHQEVSKFLLHAEGAVAKDGGDGHPRHAISEAKVLLLNEQVGVQSHVDDSHIRLSDMRASMQMETECAVFWRVPSGLAGHIVIFGVKSASGLRDLAKLVLAKSDRSLVVLSPDAKRLVEEASQDGWLKVLSEGPTGRRLFFVTGRPSSPSMLDRVRLAHASAAIFLPCVPPEGVSAEVTEREHRMIDGATVALTNFAAGEVNSGLWTVTQLLHGAAVKFFTDHSVWRSASADPRWLDIAPLNTHALFAAGQIVAGTMLDRLLIETHFNDKAIPLLGLLIFGDEAGTRLMASPLPEGFAGHRYEELCRYLLDLRMLPIGLLRDSHRSYSCIFRHSNTGSTKVSGKSRLKETERGLTARGLTGIKFPSQRPAARAIWDVARDMRATTLRTSPILDTSCEAQLPYVVTNPEPALVLKDTDRIFVLGQPVDGLGAEHSPKDVSPPGLPKRELNSSMLSRFMHTSSVLEEELPKPPPDPTL